MYLSRYISKIQIGIVPFVILNSAIDTPVKNGTKRYLQILTVLKNPGKVI